MRALDLLSNLLMIADACDGDPFHSHVAVHMLDRDKGSSTKSCGFLLALARQPLTTAWLLAAR